LVCIFLGFSNKLTHLFVNIMLVYLMVNNSRLWKMVVKVHATLFSYFGTTFDILGSEIPIFQPRELPECSKDPFKHSCCK
jgi:hypothetical protein